MVRKSERHGSQELPYGASCLHKEAFWNFWLPYGATCLLKEAFWNFWLPYGATCLLKEAFPALIFCPNFQWKLMEVSSNFHKILWKTFWLPWNLENLIYWFYICLTTSMKRYGSWNRFHGRQRYFHEQTMELQGASAWLYGRQNSTYGTWSAFYGTQKRFHGTLTGFHGTWFWVHGTFVTSIWSQHLNKVTSALFFLFTTWWPTLPCGT